MFALRNNLQSSERFLKNIRGSVLNEIDSLKAKISTDPRDILEHLFCVDYLSAAMLYRTKSGATATLNSLRYSLGGQPSINFKLSQIEIVKVKLTVDE